MRTGIGRPAQYSRIFSGFRLEPFLTAKNDLALRTAFGIAPDEIVVGAVGRLCEVKNYALLIQASARLMHDAAAGFRLRLVIVGDGPSLASFQERADQLGLGGRVHLTGRVAHEDVAPYMQAFDIALQTAAVPYASPLATSRSPLLMRPVGMDERGVGAFVVALIRV